MREKLPITTITFWRDLSQGEFSLSKHGHFGVPSNIRPKKIKKKLIFDAFLVDLIVFDSYIIVCLRERKSSRQTVVFDQPIPGNRFYSLR